MMYSGYKLFVALSLIIILISLLISGCTDTTDTRILYMAKLQGEDDYEICSISENGTDFVNLTDNDIDDQFPVVSPDRKKIAFISEQDKGEYLFVMNTDGSDVTIVCTDPFRSLYPAWSKDSKRLAYTTYDSLCTINADGTNLRIITKLPPGFERFAWSPDNHTIAYITREINDTWPLRTIDIENGLIEVVTENSTSDWLPIWAPDSSMIAYAKDVEGHNEVFITDISNKKTRQLTDYQGSTIRRGFYATGFTPLLWMPDGDNILAYLLDIDSQRVDLCLIDITTGKVNNFTINVGKTHQYLGGSFSSDGTRMVFSMIVTGIPGSKNRGDIWIVNTDGTGLTRVVMTEDSEYWPFYLNLN